MEKHKPKYHQPCDVIEIQYGHTELGSLYEYSIIPNLSYEGFVGPKGLFVGTHTNTYWQPARHVKPVQETVSYGNHDRNAKGNLSISWGGE